LFNKFNAEENIWTLEKGSTRRMNKVNNEIICTIHQILAGRLKNGVNIGGARIKEIKNA
jgi:hypothetical protein